MARHRHICRLVGSFVNIPRLPIVAAAAAVVYVVNMIILRHTQGVSRLLEIGEAWMFTIDLIAIHTSPRSLAGGLVVYPKPKFFAG